MIYEVAPGALIETDRVLDEEELAEARQEYEANMLSLETIAAQFDGTVHTPRPRENRGEFVTIHRDEYLRLLRAAGELEPSAAGDSGF